EGPHGISLEGRDEDRGGHARGIDAAHHVDSRHLRHLDVEIDEIRRQLRDGRERAGTVTAFAEHANVIVAAEQLRHAAPRDRFVVDNQRADLHAANAVAACAGRNGRRMRHTTPAGATFSRYNAAASPYNSLRRMREFDSPTPRTNASSATLAILLA